MSNFTEGINSSKNLRDEPNVPGYNLMLAANSQITSSTKSIIGNSFINRFIMECLLYIMDDSGIPIPEVDDSEV